MSNKVPDKIAKQIKKTVYKLADDSDYLAMTRVRAGLFLDDLAGRADVGGSLAKYLKRTEIRHYIKDAILNRYSKDKTKSAKPSDLEKIIENIYEPGFSKSEHVNGIHLYRSMDGDGQYKYVVISEGTLVKWETALRKALVFIAGKPFVDQANCINILLLLFAQHKALTPADKKHLEKALTLCGAKPYIYGQK